MSKKTGGPAFPASGHPGQQHIQQEGMSLRDFLAAKAMQGDMAYETLAPGATDEQLAKFASHYYRIADAMLKAREAE